MALSCTRLDENSHVREAVKLGYTPIKLLEVFLVRNSSFKPCLVWRNSIQTNRIRHSIQAGRTSWLTSNEIPAYMLTSLISELSKFPLVKSWESIRETFESPYQFTRLSRNMRGYVMSSQQSSRLCDCWHYFTDPLSDYQMNEENLHELHAP